jgi:hypothetical protein
MVASRKLTLSQTGGETETKIKRAMAAKAKKSPGNAGETIVMCCVTREEVRIGSKECVM